MTETLENHKERSKTQTESFTNDSNDIKPSKPDSKQAVPTETSTYQKLKVMIKEIGLNSSTHGIPNIIRTSRFEIKILWSTFLLLFTCICAYLVLENIRTYLEYGVTTKVLFTKKHEIDFPTISICNSNPFATPFSVDFVADYIGNLTGIPLKNQTKFDYANKILMKEPYLKPIILLQAESLDTNVKQKFGFSLKDLIIKCKYIHQDCSDWGFYWNWDFSLGNCYSFNHATNEIKPLIVKNPGISSALVLELFTGFENTVPTFDVAQGLVIKVYDKLRDVRSDSTRMVMVKDGDETTIAMKRRANKKLPQPYSGCDFDDGDFNYKKYDGQLYEEILQEKKMYSFQLCMEFCYQKYTLEKCGCNLRNDTKCSTLEGMECNDEVYVIDYKKHNFYGKCDKYCPLECYSERYALATSYRKFPCSFYAKYLLKNKPVYQNAQLNRTLHVEDVRRSLTRLVVYFEQLSYKYIEDVPTTTIINLLANSGGMLGLCIGMSLLSFIQFIECGFEAIVIIYNNEFKKKKKT